MLICGILGLAAGMIAGGIIVSKNKKLASSIDSGTDTLAEKFEEMKTAAKKKMNTKNKNKQENN